MAGVDRAVGRVTERAPFGARGGMRRPSCGLASDRVEPGACGPRPRARLATRVVGSPGQSGSRPARQTETSPIVGGRTSG